MWVEFYLEILQKFVVSKTFECASFSHRARTGVSPKLIQQQKNFLAWYYFKLLLFHLTHYKAYSC